MECLEVPIRASCMYTHLCSHWSRRSPLALWSCRQRLWVMSSALLPRALPWLGGGAGGDTLKIALYPQEPTQVSHLLILSGNLFFSHCRVRWGVSGRAPHCSTGRKEQIVLFKTDLSGNTLRGLLVCAHRRQPYDWTCTKHETHMQDSWYRWNTCRAIFVDLHN